MWRAPAELSRGGMRTPPVFPSAFIGCDNCPEKRGGSIRDLPGHLVLGDTDDLIGLEALERASKKCRESRVQGVSAAVNVTVPWIQVPWPGGKPALIGRDRGVKNSNGQIGRASCRARASSSVV